MPGDRARTQVLAYTDIPLIGDHVACFLVGVYALYIIVLTQEMEDLRYLSSEYSQGDTKRGK